MSRLDTIVLAGLIGIFAFIAFTVRLHEHLSCTANTNGAGLECERIQTKLMVGSDEHFHIPDTGTVTLRLSSHTTSNHNAVNSSTIEARDDRGRPVILVSVPGGNTVPAEELAQSLRAIGRSSTRSVSFDRDESRDLWMLILGAFGFAAVYALLLKLRNTARRRADSLSQ